MYTLSFSYPCPQISTAFFRFPYLPGIFGATPRLVATLHAPSSTPCHASHHARPRRVTPRPLDFDVFGGFWWFWFACFGGFVGLGILYQFLSFASDLLVFVDDFGGFGCVCLFLWFWWFLVGSPWGTPYHSL